MGFLGLGAKEIGEVAVPGEATFQLPAGKVKLRYVEDRAGRQVGSGRKRWSGPAADLQVSVTALGGDDPVEIKAPRTVQQGSGRTIHREIGSIELATDTECVVMTSMTVTDAHHSPRVVLRA